MGGLCCAAGLLLADLSWNDIEQVPQGLPATLVSLNLGHNRLANLPATLSALARLPNLRILHLKVCLMTAFPVAYDHVHAPASTSRLISSSQPFAPACKISQDKAVLHCCAGEPILSAAFLPVSCAASTSIAPALRWHQGIPKSHSFRLCSQCYKQHKQLCSC